jgi:hypothetical protein
MDVVEELKTYPVCHRIAVEPADQQWIEVESGFSGGVRAPFRSAI